MSATESQASGSVVVAPSVLARLVALAVHEVPGVARAGRVPPSSRISTTNHAGVAVRLTDSGALVDCYLIAAEDTNLLELGVTVQVTVERVCQDLVGVPAREVNVYIQDVEAGRE